MRPLERIGASSARSALVRNSENDEIIESVKLPEYLPALGLVLLTLSAVRFEQGGVARAAAVQFRNVADAAALRFVHQASPTPEKYYVESAPGRLVVFDYNGDGRPDIFFTNGALTRRLTRLPRSTRIDCIARTEG